MKNQNGHFPIVACLLTLCFSAIMMYILFGILLLPEKAGGMERITFSILNCLIIILLAILGNTVRRLTSMATIIQLWCVTVLYTILQFGAVFFRIDFWYGQNYVLYQMIVFFIYLCITLPVINISYRNIKNKTKEN
jgi:hypothetical protein